MSGRNDMMGDFIKAQIMMNAKGSPIKNFIYLSLFEFMSKNFPPLVSFIKNKYFNNLPTLEDMEATLRSKDNSKPILATIILEKDFTKDVEANFRIDSVLYFLSKLYFIKSLFYGGKFFCINFKDEFQVIDGIFCQLLKLDKDEDKIAKIQFKLFSYTQNIDHIKQFIDKCYTDYTIKQQNKLGDHRYFFDHIVISKKSSNYRMSVLEGAQNVYFTNNIFTTNRTFRNVYFEQRHELEHRVRFFMNRKDWYDTKGIPYTLGLMFHGIPGTGKSSTLKAIANITHRHIINIRISEIKTKTQLKQLFYDDKIHVIDKDADNIQGRREQYTISTSNRLYVIEDIDCMGDSIVMKRSSPPRMNNLPPPIQKPSQDSMEFRDKYIDYANEYQDFTPNIEVCRDCGIENKQKKNSCKRCGSSYFINKMPDPKYKIPTNNKQFDNLVENSLSFNNDIMDGMRQVQPPSLHHLRQQPQQNQQQQKPQQEQEPDSDEIDLACLLNILDGTLETPGRIIIITSNYPERLDEALIRPGRIDMIVHFKKASKIIITEMYQGFYDAEFPTDRINDLTDYLWTPAEVNQILFKNFNSKENAVDDLINKNPTDLFKFSHSQ